MSQRLAASSSKDKLQVPVDQASSVNKRVLKGREKVQAVVQEAIRSSKQGKTSVRHGDVMASARDDDSDSDMQLMNDKSKKRRGRKRERDDLYFHKAVTKIEEIKQMLKTAKEKNMSVKERQRLRNQISAQQSRIRKKEEVIFLNRVTREKDEKFSELINAMVTTLDSRDLVTIHKKLSKGCWEISEMSYKNVDFTSYKKQKNSPVDSQGESKHANNPETKSNWNFPRMTRAQSKTFTRM